MKRSRIAHVVGAITTVLALAACGGDEPTAAPGNTACPPLVGRWIGRSGTYHATLTLSMQGDSLTGTGTDNAYLGTVSPPPIRVAGSFRRDTLRLEMRGLAVHHRSAVWHWTATCPRDVYPVMWVGTMFGADPYGYSYRNVPFEMYYYP